MVESEETIEVVTTPAQLSAVSSGLAERGFSPVESGVSMQPSTTVHLAGSEAETMLRVADALEDLDDVQNVYANFDISDEEMQRIAG